MSEETTKTTDRLSADQYLRKYVEYEAMIVCADCFEIYGPWHYKGEAVGIPDINFFQLCARDCPSRNQKPDMPFKEAGEAKWPRFDFNRVVELCYCCGQEVLKSGSKWSVWFCKECKERVIEFNTQYQRTIIPIGRHSLMAGYRLGHNEVHNPEMIKTFTENVNNLFSSIDCLTKWKKFILAENFKTLGYLNDTLLKDYLAQTKNLPEKSTFFLPLREFFEQELRGRQPS